MKSMYHLLLLSILTFFSIQAWGLVSLLDSDNDRYDHVSITANTQNYIYDTDSNLIASSKQQPSRPLSKYSWNGLTLAFVDGFLVTKRGGQKLGELSIAKGQRGAVGTRRAPEFDGGKVSETGFLDSAETWLGSGYKSLSGGRYVSKDGLRQAWRESY